MSSSVLNTNIASMIARRNLGTAQTRLAESVERLSSGTRINRAKDDAAGMAVAAVVDTQVKVASTAHRNINDAISMVQTAEGALQEATSMLTRIKELATQGANDSMSRDQYYFLVQEMRQLMEELVKTADRTSFNGNKLLGGSPNASRQVTTTSTTTGQTAGVAQNTWTGLDTSGILTGVSGVIRVAIESNNGLVKLNAPTTGITAVTQGYGDLYSGAASKIAFEGTVADITSALAKVEGSRSTALSAEFKIQVTPSLPIDVGFNPANGHYYELIQTRTTHTAAKALAESKTLNGLTGYLATITSQQENEFIYRLLNDFGVSPTDQNWTGMTDSASEGVWVYEAGPEIGQNLGYTNWDAGEPNDPGNGSQNYSTIYQGTGKWNDAMNDFIAAFGPSATNPRAVVEYGGLLTDSPTFTPKIKTVTLSAPQTVTNTVTTTTTTVDPIDFNDWQFLSGAGKDDAIRLEGIPIWDTAQAAAERNNGAGYAGGAVKVGALSALYQRILWLSDPANSPLKTGQGYDIFSKNVQSIIGAPDQQVFARDGNLVSALGMSLNELLDDSILQINAHRSYFGAYAGRMEHNIANLAAQSENLTAAGSRIRDTDYGAETAALTRTQILQQAATAMLAQANAMPNMVLALLRQP